MSETSSTPDTVREVLIVDDDPGQRSLLTTFLRTQGFTPTTVSSGEAALTELRDHRYKMMISDVRMPGMSGLETLRKARVLRPSLPVLLVTAYADIKDAVGAMRDGAVNYLEKPIDLDELLITVQQAVGKRKPKPADGPSDVTFPADLIAVSPLTQQVYREALLVAPSESAILITGESGTGKATLANLIHQRSPRSSRPAHTVNCAATSSNEIDTTLFGDAQNPGLVAQSVQGTLILQEIGELPLSTQAQLLRVTGSHSKTSSDSPPPLRLIATTKEDLTQKVAQGQFRDDLYFRLNVIELILPPLRDRIEDILPFASHLIKEYTGGHARFAATVQPCLEKYDWPGNIRELGNAMERAALMAHGGIIMPKHLPNKVQAAAHPEEGGEASQNRKMADVERETILQTLRDHRNNRSETARVLGISRRALTYKLQKYRAEGYLSDD